MIAVPRTGRRCPQGTALSWVNEITPGWLRTFWLSLVGWPRLRRPRSAGGPVRGHRHRTFERRFLGGAAGGLERETFRTTGPGQMPGIPSTRSSASWRRRLPLASRTDGPDGVPPGRPVGGVCRRRLTISPSGRWRDRRQAWRTPWLARSGKRIPQAVLSFRTLTEQIDASLTQERLVATLAGSSACSASCSRPSALPGHVARGDVAVPPPRSA